MGEALVAAVFPLLHQLLLQKLSQLLLGSKRPHSPSQAHSLSPEVLGLQHGHFREVIKHESQESDRIVGQCPTP